MKKIIFLLLAVCLTTTAISQNKPGNNRAKPKNVKGKVSFSDLSVMRNSGKTKSEVATKTKEK
jgi:hypothetical protein